MNLIILADSDRTGDNTFRLVDHRADHIRSVLNASENDTIQIGLVNGPVGLARITHLTDTEILVACDNLTDPPPITPTVDLICALPRPQTLKKVLFTAAMMGIRQLHLIRANRVEKSYFHSPLLESTHYTPFLLEGLAQGKLTRLPAVCVHDRFKPFFEDTLPSLDQSESTPALRLLPDSDTPRKLPAVYRGTEPRLTIAIGPEGGWVPFEIDLMASLTFERFTLGRPILRVEHAVTAILAQIELLCDT